MSDIEPSIVNSDNAENLDIDQEIKDSGSATDEGLVSNESATQQEAFITGVAENDSEDSQSAAESKANGPQSIDQQFLQQLQEVQKKAQEEQLRSQAELQNVRRRAQKDIENAHKYAIEPFLKDWLAVVDSLERGLELIPEDDASQQSAREGLSLTLKQATDLFAKYQVETLYPVGEPFDPAIHQAMSMQESADVEPNTVLTVFQKGYLLHGRLLRPAMVIVSRQSAARQVDEQV